MPGFKQEGTRSACSKCKISVYRVRSSQWQQILQMQKVLRGRRGFFVLVVLVRFSLFDPNLEFPIQHLPPASFHGFLLCSQDSVAVVISCSHTLILSRITG